MILDLDTIIARVAEATAERLRPMVAEAVNAAMAAKPEPRIFFAPELAVRLGKTPDAFRMWLKRGGKGLAAMAYPMSESLGLGPSGQPVVRQRKAWLSDDVEAYLSRKPKLRAIAGGGR